MKISTVSNNLQSPFKSKVTEKSENPQKISKLNTN